MSTLRIRTATIGDLDQIASIEETCFPPSEAAKHHIIEERLKVYPKGCFVAEVNNQIVGFVNGGVFNDDTIEDGFFENMDLHNDDHKSFVIFGLDVHPEFQKNGYATKLMDHLVQFARKDGKEKILLTCKEYLIPYYERFGYVCHGVSTSVHGGAKWYDMTLKLNE